MALAIAMLPLGALAIMLELQGPAAIGNGGQGWRQGLRQGWQQSLGLYVPLLMWFAALLTAWFAVNRLIVRPLDAISRLIDAYGASSDPARTRLRIQGAIQGGTEIQALAASFDAMADAIDAHSRDLRGALAEQRRLTREVHHRVKNNLQIISSLLSLQSRTADSPEVLQTYALIQARIQALTQVHRWMYDDATSNGVDLQALVGEMCAGLETSLLSPHHPLVTVTCDIGAIVIHPDAAVPVAFLVTELASLAAKHVAPGPLHVRVTSARAAGKVTIAVASAGFAGTDHIAATALLPTSRIIHGMARQLRSELAHDAATGTYSVSFAAGPP